MRHHPRTIITMAVKYALLVLAILVPPHACQSGSTNFLQLFLEANNGSLLPSATNGSTPSIVEETSAQCAMDLRLINSAVNEHSFWATKCEWLFTHHRILRRIC